MMNKRFWILALTLMLTGAIGMTAEAAGKGWLVSYKQALSKAKKEKKPILADFTGSDWCGWCIKLKKEVFTKPEFIKWAKENVILLEVDFPNKPQPAALKAQNKALAQKYKIRGYPTILFLDAKGGVIGKSGYKAGGPSAWIKSANDIIGTHQSGGVKVHTLKDGLKVAREAKKPLIVFKSNDPKSHPYLEDEAFSTIALTRCVVAIDKGTEFHTLANAHGVKGYKLTAFMLDLKENKVKAHAMRDDKVSVFTKKVSENLPKITYNGEWLEDFDKASAIAASTGRRMFLNFTGSDWCGWCIKLDKEVFNQSEFKEYAKENLVLVKLDYPRRKKQDPAIKAQNAKLGAKFGIRGYPTLYILNAKGDKIGQMGYMPGGPGPFIKKLDTIK